MALVTELQFDGTSDRLTGTYAAKPAAYFSGLAGARGDFLDELPKGQKSRILEIGCGSGDTGALAFQRGIARDYIGIELFPAAAAEAAKVLTDVKVGNAETMTFDWQPASFDALILSEVLEHLVDPWGLAERLSVYVRPGGLIMVSSPNVSHYSIIKELILGRFELADHGPMDRTHMRWFTPKSYAALVERAGFSVRSVRPVTPFAARTQLLSKLTAGHFDHLFMRQIAIVGVKR